MELTKTELESLTGKALRLVEMEENRMLAFSSGADEMQKDALELFQVYDKEDSPIIVDGREVVFYRGECHGPDRLRGVFHRGSNVLLVKGNSVYVARRSDNKDLYPGKGDCSVGEHVRPGESYEQAAVRGCKEELGLDVDASDLELFLKRRIEDSEQDEYCTYYILHHKRGELVLSEELAGGDWYRIKDLRDPEQLKKLDFRKDHLIVFEEFVQGYQNN